MVPQELWAQSRYTRRPPTSPLMGEVGRGWGNKPKLPYFAASKIPFVTLPSAGYSGMRHACSAW